MAQFDVYPADDVVFPYLVDVQSNLLKNLTTRVVVPLRAFEANGPKNIKDLNPVVKIAGYKFVFEATDITVLPADALGAPVAHLRAYQKTILHALDFLFLGI